MRLSKLARAFTHHKQEAFFVVLFEDMLAAAYGLVDEGSAGVADQNAEGFVGLKLGDDRVALH